MDDCNDGGPGALEDIKKMYDDFHADNKEKELLNFKNSAGSTALHLAANNGHADIVEYLV